jgi:Flp pilus assembly protein TadD
MKLKRSSLISKGSLERIFKTANKAWDCRDYLQAIEQLERASRLNPSNSGLLLDLGKMHGVNYDYAAAERCFDQAVRIAPNPIEALAIAGKQSGDFGNFALSERYYLRAVGQSNAAPELFVQLAKLYERLRRLDESAAMLEQALQRNPNCPEALLTRARLERQAGRIETAGQILRTFIDKPNPDSWIHAQCWYELGAILDRQENYDEAMNAFVQAKALMQPQLGRYLHDLRVVRKRITDMQANLISETLQRWLDSALILQPACRLTLLGGHPRSGTTLLEQVLDSHSQIISLEETEIFHDRAYMPLTWGLPGDQPMLTVLEFAATDRLQKSRANYFRSAESFLGQPIDGRLLVDKNPSLTFLIPALIRIFPKIKLLIALRDPRDVILSCFMQPIEPGQVSSAYQQIQSTVEEYASMMSLWLALKPVLAGHFLEVRYEDMVNDLESVARKTLGFLDVPWDDRILGFTEHARKKLVRSPTYADVTQPVYKRAVGRWHHYQKYLEPHLEMLEPFVKAFGYE